MKLKERESKRIRSKRPGETKNLPLERIARGTVEDPSALLFKVTLSRKTFEKKYNTSKKEEESPEDYYTNKKKRCLSFRKKDASPGTYKKPNEKTAVRCIYHGDRKHLVPYTIYDLNWNLLWQEK